MMLHSKHITIFARTFIAATGKNQGQKGSRSGLDEYYDCVTAGVLDIFH